MQTKKGLVIAFSIGVCFFLVLGCKPNGRATKESMLLHHPQFKNLINSNHLSIRVLNTKGEKVDDYPAAVSTAIDQEIAAFVQEFGHLEGKKAVSDEIRLKALKMMNSADLPADFPIKPPRMSMTIDGANLMAVTSSKYTKNRQYRYTIVLVFP